MEKKKIHRQELYREFKILIIESEKKASRLFKVNNEFMEDLTYYNYAILYMNDRVFKVSNSYEFADSIEKQIKNAKRTIDAFRDRKFFKGDIVQIKGAIGIVEKAQTTQGINGYSVTWFIRGTEQQKSAWWHEDEGLEFIGNAYA